MMTTTTHTVTVAGIGPVDVSIDDRGAGSPYLLLHGGGGPQTIAGFAALLAGTHAVRVITPTHPGFDGTARPERLSSVGGLAALYVALLDDLDVAGVMVVGNSIGGWIAAEVALLHSPRVSRVILIDAVGIEVADHPVADFFSLTLDQMSELSFHDPDTFRIDPSKLPPAAQAALPGNRASLAVYAGTTMNDPTLAARLVDVTAPVLVLWGEADRVADVDYGRAYAAALPTARFQLLTGTGHLPQVETPRQVLDAISTFAGADAPSSVRS